MEFLAFLFGLAVGSFLNVVIDRGIRGETIRGRSHCDSCGITLEWFELIPLISFIIQKGRCRACGAALSFQYPLVELGTGLLYASAGAIFLPHLFEVGLQTSGYSVLSLLLAFVGIAAAVVIFVVDLKEKIIPDSAFLVLLGVGVLATFMRALSNVSCQMSVVKCQVFLHDISAAIIISLFFASLWFVSRGRWIGFGDAKLILATSLIIGYPAALAAFLFSFWLGGLGGGILLLTRRSQLQSTIPFGPYILVGTILAYFFGAPFFEMTGFLEGLTEMYLLTFNT